MRPTNLTLQLAEAIADHVAIGASLEVASAHEGVYKARSFHWQSKGRKLLLALAKDPESEDGWTENDKLYAHFADAIARARAKFEINILRRLDTMDEAVQMVDPATGEMVTVNKIDPKIAAALSKSMTWLLERKRREEYGSHITIKVDEAKNYLLETLERVCDRMGTPEVLGAVLDQLEAGGQEVPSEAGESPAIH